MTKTSRIYDEYFRTKTERDISLTRLKSDMGEMLDHIVLYGAGSAGIAFLYYLRDAGIYPLYFADGSETRWHQTCEGLEVLPPEEIVERAGGNCLVIVTINTDGKNYCKSFEEALRRGGPPAVHNRLREAGCKNVIEYSFFRRCSDLFKHEKYNLPSCSDIYLMEDRREDLEQIYQWLEDDTSKETFEKIIRFRMIDDTTSIPTFDQKDEYFAYDVYQRIDNEIFVDGGAYTGTTLDIFLENNRNCFSGYYAVEPDETSYQKLLKNLELKPQDVREKVCPVCAALYDSTGEKIPFYALHSPGSFVNAIGKDVVDTIRIDDMLAGREATFIKMNIEGSEIPALNGAKKTITTYSPVLSIMGYHKTWDLWEIPMMIKRFNPEYHLYLRSHMNHMSFMFYAVPQWRLIAK